MTTTPDRYVEDHAPRPGSSLYYALLHVPAARRPALAALQAVCHELDSVADEVHDPGVAATKLAWWEKEIAQAFSGDAHHPALQALLHARSKDVSLDAGPLREVVAGCRIDLEQSRFLDRPALARYLDAKTGAAAEAAARLLGASSDAAIAAARRAGAAIGHARLLRDVGRDARRGRLYLPVSELQRHDVKAHEVLKREPPGYSERFTALMTAEAALARTALGEALAGLPAAERRALRPVAVAIALHRALLDQLAAQDFRVLHQRLTLTPLRKWAVAARARWFG